MASGAGVPAHMGLPIDQAKSVYSLAYLDSCCAQAGVGLSSTGQDKDTLSVDATVEFEELGVRVQLKCTSSPKATRTGFTVPLEDKWMAKWRKFAVPPYIVLVVVPELQTGWISHGDEDTTHHSTAYWQRFNPDTKRKSIHLPASNRLTRDTMEVWHKDVLKGYGLGVKK